MNMHGTVWKSCRVQPRQMWQGESVGMGGGGTVEKGLDAVGGIAMAASMEGKRLQDMIALILPPPPPPPTCFQDLN